MVNNITSIIYCTYRIAAKLACITYKHGLFQVCNYKHPGFKNIKYSINLITNDYDDYDDDDDDDTIIIIIM